jgi:putative cell wall-binding protein
VAAALGGMGIADVHRLAGTTRFDTARLIAAQLTSSTAYVVQASDWPSAVAASALAAQTTSPILLVERTSVPAATSEALAALGASNVTVVGDAGLVTDGVLTALGGDGRTVDRLAGANRYETSRLVAARSTAAGGDPHHTWVATGVDWPDALAAGPAAAATGGVLLLVDGRSASTPALTSWVQGVSGGVEELVVVGGVASVPGSSLSSLASFVGR